MTNLSIDRFHLVATCSSSGSLYHCSTDFVRGSLAGDVIAEGSEEIWPNQGSIPLFVDDGVNRYCFFPLIYSIDIDKADFFKMTSQTSVHWDVTSTAGTVSSASPCFRATSISLVLGAGPRWRAVLCFSLKHFVHWIVFAICDVGSEHRKQMASSFKNV